MSASFGRPIILNSWLDILDMTIVVKINDFPFRVALVDQKKIRLEPAQLENKEKVPWSEHALVGEYIQLENRWFQITKIDLNGEHMILEPNSPPKSSRWHQPSLLG